MATTIGANPRKKPDGGLIERSGGSDRAAPMAACFPPA